MNDNNEAASPHLAIEAIIALSQVIKDADGLHPDDGAAVRAVCHDAIPLLAELYGADASLDQVVSCATRAYDAIKGVVGRGLARLGEAA